MHTMRLSLLTAIIANRHPSRPLNYRTSTSRKWTSFGHWTVSDPRLLESTKFQHGSCDSEPPFFAAPLTHLLNQSTTEATAVITPIQKVTKPMQPAGLFLLLLFSRAHWKDSLSDLTFKLLSSPPPGLICKGARILLPYNGFPKQNATNESYLEYRR